MDIEELRVQTIIKVIEGLRTEIVDLDRSMQRAFFVVLTVLVLFAGIYFDNKIVEDERIKGFLLFALSQIFYLIAMFVGICLSNQNVHAGHIRSLEKQANRMLGVPFLIWESEIAPKLLFSFRGTTFWAIVFFYVGIAVAFFVLMYVTLLMVENISLSAFIIFELMLMIGVAIFSNFEFKKAENLSDKIIASKNDSH